MKPSLTDALRQRRADEAAAAAEAEQRAADQATAAAEAARTAASATYFAAVSAAIDGEQFDVDVLDEAMRQLDLEPHHLDADVRTLHALRTMRQAPERLAAADAARATALQRVEALRQQAKQLVAEADVAADAAAAAHREVHRVHDEARAHAHAHALSLHERGCTDALLAEHVAKVAADEARSRAVQAECDRHNDALDRLQRFAARHRARVVFDDAFVPFVQREGKRLAELADFLDGGTGPVLPGATTPPGLSFDHFGVDGGLR